MTAGASKITASCEKSADIDECFHPFVSEECVSLTGSAVEVGVHSFIHSNLSAKTFCKASLAMLLAFQNLCSQV